MAAGARVKITLRCDECKQRNYNTVKNKKNTSVKWVIFASAVPRQSILNAHSPLSINIIPLILHLYPLKSSPEETSSNIVLYKV